MPDARFKEHILIFFSILGTSCMHFTVREKAGVNRRGKLKPATEGVP